MKKFSIVLPIYGNEKNLSVTVPYIIEHLNLFLNYTVEMIMVCDGSPDKSWEIMQEYKKQYPELIKIIKFERNFGQKMSIACGMEYATGDVIGVISADLQDPFEMFVDMLNYWEQGYDLVAGNRETREDAGIGKYFSQLLHRLINLFIDRRYPVGGFDFFLIDKKSAQIYLQNMPKYGRMQLRLLTSTKDQYFINYKRKRRKLGKSGYSLARRLRTAITVFTVDTDCVFRWLSMEGIIAAILSVALAAFFEASTGWSLKVLFCVVMALLSVLTTITGGLGAYVYKVSKKRLREMKTEE